MTTNKDTKKKELQRIDWSVVKQILTILYFNGEEKKTNMVMKTKLIYDKFVLYLEWLELMNLIKKETDDGGIEIISLSKNGLDLFSRTIRTEIY
ncbi:MAG: hypothetical protein OEW49_04060 [Nitrosopumilus sp.]|nr:hypothetical protein [Nitrosopumilus sp.]